MGGFADGVLGCTTNGDGITLIQGWDWYVGAESLTIGLAQYDFQTTVTHEIGHALGLGHSDDISSVMYAMLLARNDEASPDDRCSQRGRRGRRRHRRTSAVPPACMTDRRTLAVLAALEGKGCGYVTPQPGRAARTSAAATTSLDAPSDTRHWPGRFGVPGSE